MKRTKETSRNHSALIFTLIILATIIFLPRSAMAQQWTTNVNDINNTNTGNVGIGTSTPNALLEVKRSQNSGTLIRVDNPDSSSAWAYSGITFYQNGVQRSQLTSINGGCGGCVGGAGALQLYNFLNAPILFATNSSERMRITGGGNVGIGTADPADSLHLYSTSTTGTGFRFQNAGAGGKHYYMVSTGSGNSEGAGYFILGEIDGVTNPRRFVISSAGNIGIGTPAPSVPLEVNGNTKITGNIEVTGTINAKYQDVAEWVPSVHALPAGTVVVLNPTQSNQVMASATAYDTRVAGVVSARPGLALGEAGADKVLVATTGRVKVRVDATRAPIRVGDLLVTGDKEGVAMKSVPLDLAGTPIHRPGTLIGKALEPLERGVGEVLVLLSLQ